jgi:hypothetical protein
LEGGVLNFSQEVESGNVFSIEGENIASFSKATSFDVSELENGVYILELDGFSQRIIIE